MQLQEKCVIISALLKKTQTNKSWFMGTFEILTFPSSRKPRTVAGSGSQSWCLAVPTKLHLEPPSCSPTFLLSKEMREGLREVPAALLPAVWHTHCPQRALAVGRVDEAWGLQAENSQLQLMEGDFCVFLYLHRYIPGGGFGEM